MHINGGDADWCWSETLNISSIAIMESYCTNQMSCVGYSYNSVVKTGMLHPSDDTCPSGFEFYEDEFTESAKTMDDLVGQVVDEPGWVGCYGKNPICKSILQFEL